MSVRLRATKTMARSCARRRAYLTFAAFAVLVAYQPAEGQESSQLPTLERQQPGVAGGIPNDVLPPSDAPSIDELSAPLIGQALVSLFNDSVPRTRGAQDISLFRNAAPSVVLVRTKNGFGTGSLLKDNTILTAAIGQAAGFSWKALPVRTVTNLTVSGTLISRIRGDAV